MTIEDVVQEHSTASRNVSSWLSVAGLSGLKKGGAWAGPSTTHSSTETYSQCCRRGRRSLVIDAHSAS